MKVKTIKKTKKQEMIEVTQFNPIQLKHIICLANEGNTSAQLTLARAYHDGLYGLKPSIILAAHYYKMLATNPKTPSAPKAVAAGALGILYYRGHDEIAADLTKAFDYLEIAYAAEPSLPTARYYLALYHLETNEKRKDLKRGIELLEILNKEGYVPGIASLALAYQQGNGVPECKKKAFELHLSAAEKGDRDSQFYAGCFLREGWGGIAVDFEKAFHWFEKAALQGNVIAQFIVGTFYTEGRGVKSDASLALEWFRKAAINGNDIACVFAGEYLYQGKGVKQNFPEAFDFFEMGAKLGNLDAITHVGWCCIKGYGTAVNFKRGLENLKIAAKENHAVALGKLGICYSKGIGVPKDEKTALGFLVAAANKEDRDALAELANYYIEGCLQFKADPKYAVQLLTKAHVKGSTLASCNLGICYYQGIGVPRNFATAFEYFKTSAAEGNQTAKYYWSVMLLFGCGTTVDRNSAFKILKELAATKDPKATLKLGVCFLFRWGTNGIKKKAALKNAITLFRMAHKLNFNESNSFLGVLHLIGYGITKDRKQALEYFNAGRKTDAEAQNNIGWYYFTLGPAYYQQALNHFHSASQKGCRVAKNNIAWCLLNGLGMEPNLGKAKGLFKIANTLKKSAQINSKHGLGFSCSEGLFTTADFDSAMLFPENISELDLSRMQRNLSLCFTHGWGVEQNAEMAAQYAKLANNIEQKLKEEHAASEALKQKAFELEKATKEKEREETILAFSQKLRLKTLSNSLAAEPAIVAISQEKFEDCEEQYQKAVILFKRNAYAAAETQFQYTLKLAIEINDKMTMMLCHEGLAKYYHSAAQYKKSCGQREDSIRLYERAIEQGKQLQKLLEEFSSTCTVREMAKNNLLKHTNIKFQQILISELQLEKEALAKQAQNPEPMVNAQLLYFNSQIARYRNKDYDEKVIQEYMQAVAKADLEGNSIITLNSYYEMIDYIICHATFKFQSPKDSLNDYSMGNRLYQRAFDLLRAFSEKVETAQSAQIHSLNYKAKVFHLSISLKGSIGNSLLAISNRLTILNTETGDIALKLKNTLNFCNQFLNNLQASIAANLLQIKEQPPKSKLRFI